jgi:hypothetical protein
MSSEFSSPDVAIGFTCLAYHNEGLRYEDVKVFVAHVSFRLSSEPGEVSKRKSHEDFEAWKEESKSYCHIHNFKSELEKIPAIEHFDKSALMPLHPFFKHHKAVLFEYLNTYVFNRTLNLFSKKLLASGVDIGSSMLFASRIGFSGTPSNLLPLSLLKCVPSPGTRASVIRTLLNPRIVSSKDFAIAGDRISTELLNCCHTGQFHALVDTGALITGLKTREIAYEIMKGLPVGAFTAVVYIDDAGSKRILFRGEDMDASPKLLSHYQVPEGKRFTYYDQIHTTGIDVKQAVDATCLLTIGKGMTLRDVLQGAWRMRKIESGQKIVFHTTVDIAHMIRRELSDSFPVSLLASPSPSPSRVRVPAPLEVIQWLTKTQLRLERLQQLILSSAVVSNVWRRKAFEHLLSLTSGAQDAFVITKLHAHSRSPALTSPFVSADSLRRMLLDDDVEVGATEASDLVVTDETKTCAKEICRAFEIELTMESRVTRWLALRVHELEEKRLRCPSCKRELPEHDSECLENPQEQESKFPSSYTNFEVGDVQGPLRNITKQIQKVFDDYPDAVIKSLGREEVDDWTLPKSYQVREFQNTINKSLALADPRKRREVYNEGLAKLEENRRGWNFNEDLIWVCVNGKYKQILVNGYLYSKESDALVTTTAAVTTEGPIVPSSIHAHLANKELGNLYCLAIAAFRESMDYPAGISASAKLSTKLENLYQDPSVKPLLDTSVFTYSVANKNKGVQEEFFKSGKNHLVVLPALHGSSKADSSSGKADSSGTSRWNAEEELHYYISDLKAIESIGTLDADSAGSGLDTEQE